MGWFWGSSSASDDKYKDPLRDLDPSLREFLKKESPIKYSASNPPAAPQPQKSSTPSQSPLSTNPATTSNPEADPSPQVPAQSLYKDGRYAHLWKTYQSQQDVEAVSKTDQEKIEDVLAAFKYRKAEIGRAALENCALEQGDVQECFKSGGWASRMTMCRTENRQFERCYMMQGKFLKALGYLSTLDRPAEVDERIQMHADTLYHRMLAQEKAVEAAKAEGRPAPEFPPLLASSRSKISAHASPEPNKLKPTDLSPKVQAEFKKRLDGLSGNEKELEEKAINAEIQAGAQVAENLGGIYERQAEERRVRKEQGKETIGDKISSVFGSR
ncbi:hypothetical protein BUE80_DR003664 [Diplocarpon rosae]|nr:hypothetical protein BUE80_DR003664 [Diplocarpon rosae]